MTGLLRKPVFGTGLTQGGALAIVAIAPAFWTIFALILVVTP
jgi:hypothetical protein